MYCPHGQFLAQYRLFEGYIKLSCSFFEVGIYVRGLWPTLSFTYTIGLVIASSFTANVQLVLWYLSNTTVQTILSSISYSTRYAMKGSLVQLIQSRLQFGYLIRWWQTCQQKKQCNSRGRVVVAQCRTPRRIKSQKQRNRVSVPSFTSQSRTFQSPTRI